MNTKKKYPVFATEFTVAGLATNLRKWDSVRNEPAGIVSLDDLLEEGKESRGKQEQHRIALKAVERIRSNEAALKHLSTKRENYRGQIKSYLEDRKISWTGFTFYSDYPEFSLINGDYTPTEQGEWFKEWLREKNTPQ